MVAFVLSFPSPSFPLSSSLAEEEEEEEEEVKKVKTGKNFIIICWSDEAGGNSSGRVMMDPCSFVDVVVVTGVVELKKNSSVSRGGWERNIFCFFFSFSFFFLQSPRLVLRQWKKKKITRGEFVRIHKRSSSLLLDWQERGEDYSCAGCGEDLVAGIG